MTDFLELLTKRQSVRNYKNIPVEAEKLERCLEAARLSPSACNSQPWTFIVVDEPELKEKAIMRHTLLWRKLGKKYFLDIGKTSYRLDLDTRTIQIARRQR